jgi:hypothetical protein
VVGWIRYLSIIKVGQIKYLCVFRILGVVKARNIVYVCMYVQSPVKVTDKTLGARKNAKDQEHL